MIILAILLSIASSPASMVDRCDLIELNHMAEYESGYFSLDGEYTPPKLKKIHCSQYIFWRWNEEYRRYDARDYVVVSQPSISKPPSIVVVNGWYRVTWVNWKSRFVVESKNYKETTTTFDPERENIKVMQEQYREKIRAVRR